MPVEVPGMMMKMFGAVGKKGLSVLGLVVELTVDGGVSKATGARRGDERRGEAGVDATILLTEKRSRSDGDCGGTAAPPL